MRAASSDLGATWCAGQSPGSSKVVRLLLLSWLHGRFHAGVRYARATVQLSQQSYTFDPVQLAQSNICPYGRGSLTSEWAGAGTGALNGSFAPMRKRLSYAQVAATLALVFSLSGGAFAANRYLITSTSQIKPSVMKKLRSGNHRGPAGPEGKTGPSGPEGHTRTNAVGVPGAVYRCDWCHGRRRRRRGRRHAGCYRSHRSDRHTGW